MNTDKLIEAINTGITAAAIGWVDLLAGIAETKIDVRNSTRFRIPVWLAGDQSCTPDKYQVLVPNNTRKSILFWEVERVSIDYWTARYNQFKAGLILKVWYNQNLIDYEQLTPDLLIGEISGAVPFRLANTVYYQACTVVPTEIGYSNIYANYDLDEGAKQFLTWPYGSFWVRFEAEYRIAIPCMPKPNANPKQCLT